MTPSLKIYSKFVLQNWTLFSHIVTEWIRMLYTMTVTLNSNSKSNMNCPLTGVTGKKLVCVEGSPLKVVGAACSHMERI